MAGSLNNNTSQQMIFIFALTLKYQHEFPHSLIELLFSQVIIDSKMAKYLPELVHYWHWSTFRAKLAPFIIT